MFRWIVRLLAFATLVWLGTLAVDAGHHQASAQRIVVDTAAQPLATHAVTKSPTVAKAATTVTDSETSTAQEKAKAKRVQVERAVCSQASASYEIIVSIKRQQLWACRDQAPVLTSKVTTGAIDKDWATPTGTWKIYAKQTARWLTGPGYQDWVHYWMPFYGGYGLHDSTWQTFAYGSQLYRSQGSHGCVQIPLRTMARIYAWAPVGSTVHVEA